MRQTLTCSFCRNKFDAPSALCPHCGGPVADAGIEALGRTEQVYAVANDDSLELDGAELKDELVVVPVGGSLGSPVGPDVALRPAPAKARPPPLPRKRIARA